MSIKDRFGGDSAADSAASAQISGIAMYDAIPQPKDASIGQLAKTAAEQVSTLVRSEIELAKAEIGLQVKRGAMGSIFFIIAAVFALMSFFPFIMMWAKLFSLWLGTVTWDWCGYLIVFLLLLVFAGIFVGIGIWKMKQIEKPEKTIESVEQLKEVVPSSTKAAPSGYTYLQ